MVVDSGSGLYGAHAINVPMNQGSITDKNANMLNNIIGGATDYEAQMMKSGGFYPNN